MNIPSPCVITLALCPRQLQSELDKALDNNKELTERLQVAHIERREALDERDSQLSKYHVEWERRKKAEREVSHVVVM